MLRLSKTALSSLVLLLSFNFSKKLEMSKIKRKQFQYIAFNDGECEGINRIEFSKMRK